ncbi:hypothetical protein [Spirosoma panaciterrae]|uniref:hypothetical protein n=1 Tax=Spirosoma panaciterrae TaxID=496058 RepID=UPI00035D02EE|nr:hypothetical protein [Spirosoma panaciterrae]
MIAVRTLLTRLFTFWALLAIGCYNRDLDPVGKQSALLTTDPTANWSTCQTMYWTMGNSTPAFSGVETSTIQAAFDEYTNVGSTLRFEQRSTQPNVTVVQVAAANMKGIDTPGLISYQVKTLSSYTVDANKNATIYINADAKLTVAQLKAILMHQIGRIVGLAVNNFVEASVMALPDLQKPVAKLDASDIKAILAKFGTECPQLLAGTDNLAEPIFDNRCGGIRYLIETNKAIYDDARLTTDVQQAADIWNSQKSYAQFRLTTKPDSALIRIRFAPKESFAVSQVSDGTVSLSMLPLSKLEKGSTPGTANILLRQDFKWNDNTLRQAVAQQLGYYLGFTRSTDPTSIMYVAYRPEQPLTTLGSAEKITFDSRFGQYCPLTITVDAGTLKLPGPKYFGKQILTYQSTVAKGLSNVPDWAGSAIDNAFKTYSNAGFLHRFGQKTATDKIPTFTVSLASASAVGSGVTAKITYTDISGMDGYTILLNWEADSWTQTRLQSALSQIIGQVLGLPVSSKDTDLMYGTVKSINPNTSLTTDEIATLKKLYTFNNSTTFLPVAGAFITPMNTQNVPNCIVRANWNWCGANSAASVSHDFTKGLTQLNANLPTVRFASYSVPTSNYSIFFCNTMTDVYLNASYTARQAGARLAYNRLSYLSTSVNDNSIRYSYSVYVNSNEPQLRANNGAGLINLEMYWMGHLMGLPDSDDQASIMYPYLSTTVKTPTADDIQKLNAAFGPCAFGAVASGWRKVVDNFSFSGIGYVFNNKSYMFGGSAIFLVDVNSRQLSLKANLYQSTGFSGYTSFASADKLYMFGGSKSPATPTGDYLYDKSLYEFDPVTERLTKIADFPGQGRAGIAGLAFDGKCYIGGGYYSYTKTVGDTAISSYSQNFSDAWLLDLTTGRWTQQQYLQYLPSFNTNGIIRTLVYNGKGYAFFNSVVYQYTLSSDTWQQLPGIPNNRSVQYPFQIGDYVYGLGGNGDNAFYRFDLKANSWSRLPDPNIAPPLYPYGSFSINGKGYVSGSPVYTPSKPTEVWEYTPQ